jgi:CheY-like chemotaxis protein
MFASFYQGKESDFMGVEMMRPQILVVDDDYGSVLLINEIFDREGIEVGVLSKGGEVLPYLSQERNVALIFLDILLPDISGIVLVKMIKEKYPQIAVLMLTAYLSKELQRESFEAGSEMYFVKPIDIEIVVKTAKKYLKRWELEQTLSPKV